MAPKTYTAQEIADIMKVSRKTVRKWIREKALRYREHWVYAGRQIRIKQAGLDKLMGE